MWWSSYDVAANATQWDPSTGTNTALVKAKANIFCAGHSFLANGQLLVTGGHITPFTGLPDAYTYDPLNGTWKRLPDMNDGRWYPTNTTLPDGDVLVVSGWVDTSVGVNVEPQVWQTATNSWRNLTAAHLALPFYPFMFAAPNGKVFCAGPARLSRYLSTSGTGSWNSVGNNKFGIRNWGSAVMYDNGKVLIMGGTTCDAYSTTCGSSPTATAEIIDLNSGAPTWSYTGSMKDARKLHNATLLADGKVLVTGGSKGTEDPNTVSSDPAYTAEMWDPATGTWSTMASFTVFRGYHSVALLLPDGRVLSAGGDFGGPTAEVYSPPYLFKGSRPTISSAPSSIAYGQRFFVGTPNVASISKITMLALGSVTHGFNMGQRIVRPPFSQGSGGLNVTAPASGIVAPPGYYMLFILNSNGVPSVAKMVQVGGSASPTPTPTPAPPIQLLNISARFNVQTGDKIGITGFVVLGTGSKKVLVRALGPSLQVNAHPIPGFLPDPKLELHDHTGALLVANDNWMSSPQAAQIQANGFAPGDDHESAIISTLPAGGYTAVVSGTNNTTGIALAEIYDLETHSASQLVNVSARAHVMTGDNVLIDGIVIGSGTPKSVLFRALGPTLAAQGVTGELRDPMLDLCNSNGVVIGHNDNWQSAPNHAAMVSAGLAPTDNRESAIMMVLPGGNYTAILRGVNNTSGTALAEAYRLQ